jgi:putative component of membrane protein insertase Oxa1/YidC/SpoIIIJ protein YidD
MKRVALLASWLMLLMLVSQFAKAPRVLAAEDPMNGPWDSQVHRSSANKHNEQTNSSIASGFFTSLLTFFSEVISPVDGDRCPSYPTCAAYSKEAYQKHGAFVGTLMTVDRLFHEADEYRFSPTVKVYGVYRIYDPVSANEYWKRNDNSKAEAKPTE